MYFIPVRAKLHFLHHYSSLQCLQPLKVQ